MADILERFDNIYRFMDTIEKRPQSPKMGDSHSSHDNDDSKWSGTKTWAEAMELFSNGIPKVKDEMTSEIKKLSAQCNVSHARNTPRRYYHGYAPNIPAAIIGLPKAMYQLNKQPKKVKAIELFYDGTMNCGTSAETLRKSGTAVLKLIYLLELHGYRVQLNITCFNGTEGEEKALLCILLKEWRQPLDVLKLSFPLTSPAMFRRFGFKWLETNPEITKNGWQYGYGHHMEKDDALKHLRKFGVDTRNLFFIGVPDCKSAEFDPVKLAENLGITV